MTHAGFSLLLLWSMRPAAAQMGAVTISWDSVTRVSNTTASLQVVVNPPLRRGSKIHDRVFEALRDLQPDYARFVPWLPYPRLAVAELEPPHDGQTSWDFSLIDPLTIDFLEATKGHPSVLNFSTTPQWMWITPNPVTYPADPEAPVWNYTQGTELRDPSGRELGAYYARLVSWYTLGGFVDEFGKRHESGHHYDVAWCEVLNEPDLEHRLGPKKYTEIYDAIVTAVRAVAPRMKFVGSLGGLPGARGGDVRVLPESAKSQARHSIGRNLVSLLLLSGDGRTGGGAAVHGLGPDRRFSEHGALRRSDPKAAFAEDGHDDQRSRSDFSRRRGAESARTYHQADSRVVLESVRRFVCVPLRRTGEHGNRNGERVATGGVSDAIPECVAGRLGDRSAQRAVLGTETVEGSLWPGRSTGADGAAGTIRLRAGLS